MHSNSTSKVRVAIADDDATQRMLLQRLVEGLGHQVVWLAENGEQAIALCGEHRADVVLMDLDMPEVDGLEAAEQISEWGIPVVLISGMPDAGHLVVDLEPIVSRLSKPVTRSAISRAITKALHDADVNEK